METGEIISLIVSIFAGIATVGSLGVAWLTYKMSKKIGEGQIELQVRELITTAKGQLYNATPGNLEKINSLMEDVRNAYDEACAKYLDGKIDKERFKKMYYYEITQIVVDENNKSFYVLPQTKLMSTVEVYNEWLPKA